MHSKEILEKSYEDLAPLSKRWRKEFRLHNHTLNLVCKYFNDFENKKILDIGCGLGVLVRAFSKLGARAEGIDKHILVEWGNLDDIKRIWQEKDINIKVDDFFNAYYLEASLDIITSEDLFEHLRLTQKEFLEKVYRILKPGGYLFLATPNLTSFLKRFRMLFGRSPYWDLDDFFLNKMPFGHIREFTARELKRMAELIGFEVVEIKAQNVYFSKRWFWRLKKFPRVITYLLSFLFPNGRDILFLVAKKKKTVL